VAIASGLTAAVALAQPAVADDDQFMNNVCAAQYPEGDNYVGGTAYLIAPGDAFSWRCQQVSKLPGGGAITGLGVDPDAYCRSFHQSAVASNPGNPRSWTCVG
jgi:hypothetical protein